MVGLFIPPDRQRLLLYSGIERYVEGEEIFRYQAIGPATLAWLPRLFGRKVVATVQGLDWDRAKWGRLARWYLKLGEWAACHFPHTAIGGRSLRAVTHYGIEAKDIELALAVIQELMRQL